MFLLAQMTDGTTDVVGKFVAVAGLVCVSMWAIVRWLSKGPARPDPWDAEVTSDMEKAETLPLCHRCLNPHDPMMNFCPVCGAPVGPYTNWLPYPSLFSVGHTLRIGTSGEFERSPLTIIGFMLFGIYEYSLFVPIYWVMLFRNLSRLRQLHNLPGGDVTNDIAEGP